MIAWNMKTTEMHQDKIRFAPNPKKKGTDAHRRASAAELHILVGYNCLGLCLFGGYGRA